MCILVYFGAALKLIPVAHSVGRAEVFNFHYIVLRDEDVSNVDEVTDVIFVKDLNHSTHLHHDVETGNERERSFILLEIVAEGSAWEIFNNPDCFIFVFKLHTVVLDDVLVFHV